MPTPSAPWTGHLLYNLLLFGRVLRSLGLDVHADRMLDVVQVLDDMGIGRKRDFHDALRTLLVHRQQDLALFDEAFQVFWRRPPNESTTMDLHSLGEQRRFRQPQVGPPPTGSDRSAQTAEGIEAGQVGDRVEITATYSSREVLRSKDFAKFTADETAEAKEMMSELAWDLGMRQTRRWVPGRGPVLDLRRAFRVNLKYGGEIVDLPRRRRKDKQRPLVLICDVSGSMERYTRMLLHFIHCMAGGLDKVESFLFATRLTRITGLLPHRGIDKAVTEVSQAVPDWAGGTRIGETVKEFNFQWARRVLGWGSVVLIISDGWDRGQPELLGLEMARLQRSCHRCIWLNPLLGSSAYEPLTRGMKAALPFVDDFLPVHNLASLEDLARYLNTLSPQPAARRQHILISEGSPDSPASTPSPPVTPSRHRDANPNFRHPLWGRRNG